MKTENRRRFLKKSVVVTAGIAAGAPAYIKGYSQVKPSDKINVAVAGIRSRGKNHIENFIKINDSRVVAICDVDENLFAGTTLQIEKLGGDKPKIFNDFRKMLEDKSIDVISIATPGYWHALQTIWACQAGKDVYVEKPVSYNILEGRKMVQAAGKYERIVQVGMQRRANRAFQQGVRLLQEGAIGDIYMGRGLVYRHRASIGRVADSPVPAGVNWDLYRGPAPMIPFNKNHFHYNWHWYWDTSTSEFGNNGIHVMDRIRMAMKIDTHPSKISCRGGFYGWDSDQEIPNLEVAIFQYDDGKVLELEVRSLFTPGEEGSMMLFGTKGYALLGNGVSTFIGTEKKPGPKFSESDLKPEPRWDEFVKAGVDYHFVNFLDCVKSRKKQDLIAEIGEGHLSTAMMHLGNIAYRTGRTLTFDGKSEKFINDDDANTYLTRKEYRKPYVLPEVV